MRRKDDKRKDARIDKKERNDKEKHKKHEELNQLKQFKKEEILEKLKKADIISGAKLLSDGAIGNSEKRLLEKIEKELKTDFIPELYDRAMEKMFDEKYYEAELDADEEKAAARALDINIGLMNDTDRQNPSQDNDEESKGDDMKEDNYSRELVKPMQKRIEEQYERDY